MNHVMNLIHILYQLHCITSILESKNVFPSQRNLLKELVFPFPFILHLHVGNRKEIDTIIIVILTWWRSLSYYEWIL